MAIDSTATDPRILQIQELLLRFAQMDFSGSIALSEKGDDIDAIIVGMNTLAEELRARNLKREDN